MKTESQEGIALMQWCKRNMKEYPDLELIFHIPNGGKRNIAVASKLKLEGVKPGIPDYYLPVANRGYHGLFLELKRVKKGSLSPKQKVWFKLLREKEFACVRANGAEHAIKLIKGYLNINP